MWLKAHMTMTLRKQHIDEIPGRNRAVLMLSASIRQELLFDDADSALVKEKHLKNRIETELQGGIISYAYSDAKLHTPSFIKAITILREAFRTWININKWWYAALVLTSLCATMFWVFVLADNFHILIALWYSGLVMLPGLIITLFLTSTTGSRAVLISYWCVLALIMFIFVIVTLTKR